MTDKVKRKEILISIVVPIYNSEQHLSKCIESILRQTYGNIEIILVNDGSTDNSLKIARDYAKKDSRILVINQENSGGVISRKNGIKKAKGDYVIIEDSDDWLEENLIEKCVEAIEKHDGVDIVKFGFIFEPSKKERNLLNDGVINKEVLKDKEIELVIERLIYETDCNQVWNEMVKRSLYDFSDGIFDKIVHKGEDLQINLQIFQKAKKIVFLKDNLYHYLDNPSGITNDISTGKVISNIKDSIYLNNVRKNIAIEKFGHANDVILKNKTASILSNKIIRILATNKNPKKDLCKIQKGLDEVLPAYFAGFEPSMLTQKMLKRKICLNIIKNNYIKNLKYRPVCKLLRMIGKIK